MYNIVAFVADDDHMRMLLLLLLWFDFASREVVKNTAGDHRLIVIATQPPTKEVFFLP